MIVELHANPGKLSPEAFAQAVEASGIDGVVVTCADGIHKVDDYVDAVKGVGREAFVGVECTMERGAFVFVPREDNASFRSANWKPEGKFWTPAEVKAIAASQDGALLATHPYCREEESPMGDRVYMVKALKAVVTRMGKGQLTWDRLAEQAARKRGLAEIGSCGGAPERLGSAATSIAGTIGGQADLVTAIEEKRCIAVEMDEPGKHRDRSEPKPIERMSNDRDRGRGRDDRRGGRGGRDGRGRGGPRR